MEIRLFIIRIFFLRIFIAPVIIASGRKTIQRNGCFQPRGIGCRSGGSKGWQLYSISRWTREDGRKLKEQLELEFEIRRNRQIYWDDVPMFCYFGEYELEIYPMNRRDVKEIDNIKELAAIDKNYLNT